jgi:hypothetical protein
MKVLQPLADWSNHVFHRKRRVDDTFEVDTTLCTNGSAMGLGGSHVFKPMHSAAISSLDSPRLSLVHASFHGIARNALGIFLTYPPHIMYTPTINTVFISNVLKGDYVFVMFHILMTYTIDNVVAEKRAE